MISSDRGEGNGPQRVAFREVLYFVIEQEGQWRNVGDTMVPSDSPLADRTYWQVVGGFLALGWSLASAFTLCLRW